MSSLTDTDRRHILSALRGHAEQCTLGAKRIYAMTNYSDEVPDTVNYALTEAAVGLEAKASAVLDLAKQLEGADYIYFLGVGRSEDPEAPEGSPL